MTQDNTTTLGELRELVQQFVDERDWQQFHSPKNLTMALAIEVAELMEHFQWITTEASREHHHQDSTRNDIQDELADVFCYVLALANEMEMDLSSSLRSKMVKNRAKYPAEEYHGKF